jgi:hypothetical protein
LQQKQQSAALQHLNVCSSHSGVAAAALQQQRQCISIAAALQLQENFAASILKKLQLHCSSLQQQQQYISRFAAAAASAVQHEQL